MVRSPRDRSPIENLAFADALLMRDTSLPAREATELIRIAREELIRQKQRNDVVGLPPLRIPTE